MRKDIEFKTVVKYNLITRENYKPVCETFYNELDFKGAMIIAEYKGTLRKAYKVIQKFEIR